MTALTRNPVRLSGGQRVLATAILLLALAVTPIFFIVMFLTVNKMLGPGFDGWAWTVPVATEAVFMLLFLWALLMEWMRRPKRALWLAPYPFAVMSAFLNVWAARGTVPGMAGHLAVTLAFFVPVTFAKTGVRSLLVTDPERERSLALADARAHARDILRSALGPLWRWRAPVLLRRQLRSGRLPASVMAAVESCDAARWERSVETWITAAVVLPERFAGVLAAARAEASQSAPAGAPDVTSGVTGNEAAGVPADASGVTPGSAPQSAPESAPAVRGVTPGRASGGASGRHARLVPSKATDEELADLVVPLLAKSPVSKYRVIEAVREAAGGKGKPSIGDKRAGDVLTLAQERAGATVVQIDARKHA